MTTSYALPIDGVSPYVIPGYEPPTQAPFPGYVPTLPIPPQGGVPIGVGGGSPTAPPPQLQFTYDTIGQIIPRTIGHCRVGLKTIWVAGQQSDALSYSTLSIDGLVPWLSGTGVTYTPTIGRIDAPANTGDGTLHFTSVPSWVVPGATLITPNAGALYATAVTPTSVDVLPVLPADVASGTGIVFQVPFGLGDPGSDVPSTGGMPAPTITFAAALCNPIDPLELGNVTAVYDGADQVYSLDGGGLILPPGWSPENQNQLEASLNGALVYPGTEGQEPAPLIVADRGATATNAFRGLRYIILQDYPIVGSGGAALPRLSVVWRRSNPLPRPTLPPDSNNRTAVEFGTGSG